MDSASAVDGIKLFSSDTVCGDETSSLAFGVGDDLERASSFSPDETCETDEAGLEIICPLCQTSSVEDH